MNMKFFLLAGALLPFAAAAVEIEAEAGTILNPKGALVKDSAKASGGKVVVMKMLGGKMAKPAKDAEPSFVVKFNAEKDGVYTITAYINAATTSNDSFFFALDDTAMRDIHTGYPKVNAPVVLLKGGKLAKGEHQLKFWPRESGFEFDKFVIEEAK